MEKVNAGGAGSMGEKGNLVETDYLDSLVDKMEALGLAEESYVNQLSGRLEPILGEADEEDSAEEIL